MTSHGTKQMVERLLADHLTQSPLNRIRYVSHLIKALARQLKELDATQIGWGKHAIKDITNADLEQLIHALNIDNSTSSAPQQKELMPCEAEGESIIDKREKVRALYGLDGYYSFREIGLITKLPTFDVKHRLALEGLIQKRVSSDGSRSNFILTDSGWEVGVMYDPKEKTLRSKSDRSAYKSNQQIVMKESVLSLFK